VFYEGKKQSKKLLLHPVIYVIVQYVGEALDITVANVALFMMCCSQRTTALKWFTGCTGFAITYTPTRKLR